MKITDLLETRDIQPLMLYGNGWVVLHRKHVYDRMWRGLDLNMIWKLMQAVTRVPNLESEVDIGQKFWISDRKTRASMGFRRVSPVMRDPDNVFPQARQQDFKGYLEAGTVVRAIPIHDSNTKTFLVDI